MTSYLMSYEKTLPQLCPDPEARMLFEKGLDYALKLDRPGICELGKSVECYPEFALAYGLLGWQQHIHGYREAARESLIAAKVRDQTPYEQSVIEIIDSCLSFSPSAIQQCYRHLAVMPDDRFVLALLLGPFGLLAFSNDQNWKEKNVWLVDSLAKHYSEDDWWYCTTKAFVLGECNYLEQAHQAAERAWSLNQNGNTAHAMAHVLFELGDHKQGGEFLDHWHHAYGETSDMAHHLRWHQSVIYYDLDRSSQTSTFYQDYLDPAVSDPMPLTTISDNASFLWRCHLNGHTVSEDSIQCLSDYIHKHFPETGFGFVDLHRDMLLALMDHPDLALAGEFFPAFQAYSRGDYQHSANLLEVMMERVICLGGSNPQRRVVWDTLQMAKQHQTS